MNTLQRIAAQHELRELLDSNPVTRDMTIRARGASFVLGREDPAPNGPYGSPVPDDRLRLSHLGGARYGLSVRRHTGRWEKTPFTGTLPQLVDVIVATMQHLVAAW